MIWETKNGSRLSRLGQGTWKLGMSSSLAAKEVGALQRGFELGLRIVDTAQMYAEGQAERVVGMACAGCRDEVFITTKVWPSNGSREGIPRALQASLERLKTDYVDLYLFHWPSKEYPMEESMEGLVQCLDQGLTRHIGVSNFPVSLLKAAQAFAKNRLTVDQVEYSLTVRQAEATLIPYAAANQVALMAYSPLRHLVSANLSTAARQALRTIAQRLGVTVQAVALAFILRQTSVDMVAIPKTANLAHLESNSKALGLKLTAEDEALLDAAFPRSPGDLQIERY